MQAVRLMNQGALVIDLRGREQFDGGHIGEARNIPAAALAAQLDTLEEVARKKRHHLLRHAAATARLPHGP